MHDLSGHAPGPPPSFEQAKNRRQKARSAGLDPNHWYAVEQSKRIRNGDKVEVKFLGRSMAVFRGDDGRLRAIENRCAHRNVKLTEGKVVGCELVCPYHGWSYDGEGRATITHDLFGHKSPNIRIASVPVRERYGLVFLFPGDPELATTRDIPILMVTALNEMGDIEKAVAAGCDDFLTKPVNRLELTTRVRSLLRVRHLTNERDRLLAYLAEVEAALGPRGTAKR